MSEQNNDRLEDFFRKAAGKPDVTFNEADWKKLEARLDAQEGTTIPSRTGVVKWVAGIAIMTVVLSSGGIWLNSKYKIVERTAEESAMSAITDQETTPAPNGEEVSSAESFTKQDVTANPSSADKHVEGLAGVRPQTAGERIERVTDNNVANDADNLPRAKAVQEAEEMVVKAEERSVETSDDQPKSAGLGSQFQDLSRNAISPLDNSKVRGDLSMRSPIMTIKIKQKAVVDLPGAEEGYGREAKANVSAEHASVQKQRLAAPRLSLLLSLAPDFSSTSSMTDYSRPGKAFGASLIYHFYNRWAVSVGAIKNYKKYSSSGEYYKPPSGYWKRNTNGIVPSTIDGSCNLVEFPVMVQYTALDKGVNRWFISAGASSYLMQAESYDYNFDEPNPGAKSGWHANRTSPFMFNMINFSVGYEHDVLPGFTIGIEPYLKIPIENIGWPNVKLFSTGASITMRYALFHVRSTTSSLGRESPSPD